MDKFINFIDERVVQCDVPVVKDTFVDDGNLQIVARKFDRNTKCTFSGTNFVFIFSFPEWSYWPLLTPEVSYFITKNILNAMLHEMLTLGS